MVEEKKSCDTTTTKQHGAGQQSSAERKHSDAPSLFHGIMRSLGFMAVLYAVLLVLSAVVTPHNPVVTLGLHFPNQFDYTLLDRNSLDLIFVGDSSAQSSFAPELIEQRIGIRSYNSARPLQKLAESDEIANDTFNYHHTKVVVAETNNFFHRTGVRMVMQDVGRRVCPLLRYHSNWKLIATGHMDDNPQGIAPHMGYKKKDQVVPYKGGDYMKDKGNKISLTPIAEYYLNDLKKSCEEHGAKLVLVSAPNAREFTFARHVELERWAKKNGVAYYDMNDPSSKVGIDWSVDSRDGGTHLNFTGATKASNWLADRLYADLGIGHEPTGDQK